MREVRADGLDPASSIAARPTYFIKDIHHITGKAQ
jgi:hypothetical protein